MHLRKLLGFVCLFSLTLFALETERTHAESPGIETIDPAVVDIAPVRVFTPLGFDDNDNVQVVLDGELDNTCYRLGPVQKQVDHAKQRVYIRQQAYFYSSAWCAQVRVSYVQPVNLGIMRSGVYEVYLYDRHGAAKSMGMLPIAVSKSANPDDYLYAPLLSAHLEKSTVSAGGGKTRPSYKVVLNGAFNNTCMHFKETKIMVRPKQQVIEVLPIVEIEGTACAQIVTEFTESVSLGGLPQGRYLIHIRSLNGQSLNQIVDL